MTLRHWMPLLLFTLCFHIEPAACKPAWMMPQFPCDVKSDNTSSVLFDCRGRHLSEVPHGITSNATDLKLSENYLKNISADSFSALQNLSQLDLSRANKNKGLIIAANTFKNLTKLRSLRLTGNRLTDIPGNIPSSVEILDVHFNNILRLDNRSLAGLANVTQLWSSRNCFYRNPCGKAITVMDGSFALMPKLEKLDLSFNNITKIPQGLPRSLNFLLLASNQIQYISEDDFSGLPNLKTLYIQGNCQRCHNAPYPCVPCRNISIGIHPNAFHGLTQLELLSLAGNSLTHLNPSWFEKLRELKQLFLSFNLLMNEITKEATFLTCLQKLEKIDLSFNFAHQYYPSHVNLSKEFSNLVALKTLHLEGLVFQNIGPDTLSPLYMLKNLSVLNLGTNFIIHSGSMIFKKFSHLRMIYLGENRLYPMPVRDSPDLSNRYHQGSDVSIPPLLAQHPKDQVYELTHGLVKQECFDSGRVIVLSSNNLFFITPWQFEQYGNVSCLNLSRNGFSAALNGTEFSLLPDLTYLDLSFNKIDLAFDNAFQELKKLQVLDLSFNSHYFRAFGVTLNLNFTKNLPVLRVLNMSYNAISTLTTKRICSKSLTELRFSNNNLGKLWEDKLGSYKKLFTDLTNLTILDISRNSIKTIPGDVYEYLPRNLTTFLIHQNKLSHFQWDKLKWLPCLQTLDLSGNFLTKVTGSNLNITDTLTFLDLSHNHIFQLDHGFLKSANTLQILSLNNNKLTIINQSTFQFWPKSQIKTLFLHKNPFQCTCDSLDFLLWMQSTDVKIPKLSTAVSCGAPANRRGRALIHFDIKQCVDDSKAFLIYIFTYCFIIVFMFVATVTQLFYWDASYILHYMRAKFKGYRSLSSPGSAYDVFVMYDTTDPHVSEWVMKNLQVKLEEEGEKHLPLCLEERDWTPGVPLVDNLTQSIRYSRKTLFVLTKNFVKTGTFKLAMYLAHQRLLDENVDVIVLLMLEPVLQHSPFLRLRKRLCGKSVVEWPRTAAAEPWFWQNLRSVVRVDNQVMYNKTYSKYFTNN
ncbi:toll-like receptor 8 [Cheilinus undulatus]|uniref:toll-like receptor 8 n=1 Tax=Cheilinus undulatus TaxID=241271 RepID=UPI001BD4FE30|nr:toll-like receptor 8 [Cheilinus undulatus]